MPTPNQASLDFLRGKTTAPSEMRTAEWSRLDREIRERAFFMAAVEDAEILDRFRAGVESIVRGEKGESEVMAELHDYLKARGYRPLPGEEGTIKDLRSIARQRVALRTNVEAARSYGQWRRQQKALAAFPATRYKRGRQANEPRDWPARWNAAREATTEAGATRATGEDDMVALTNHALWTDPEFNRLGSPWPPYDFGSGMMCRAVSRAEATRLGLMPAEDDTSEEADYLRGLLKPQDRSFNEALQARPAVASEPLRDALADRLRGLAKWDGPVLRFTDPNGTRPMTQAELIDAWATPLPEKFRTKAHPEGLMQRDAFVAHVGDSSAFEKKQGTDQWEDWQRVLGRLVNTRQPEKLYRGMQMDAADLDTFLRRIEKDGYTVMRDRITGQWLRGADSWTDNPKSAARYANLDEPARRDRWSVVMEIAGSETGEAFKEIGDLVQAFQPLVPKKLNPPVASEAEWVFRIGHRLVAGKPKRDAKRRLVTILLTLA